MGRPNKSDERRAELIPKIVDVFSRLGYHRATIQVYSQVEGQIWRQVRDQVRSQVRHQVMNQVYNQVLDQVDTPVGDQVWRQSQLKG